MPLLWGTNFIFTQKNGYEEFAAFSVCLQWFTILNYLPQQLGQVRPIYTQLYAEGDMKKFKKSINKMIIFSTSFAVVVALVLMLGSKLILKMYGTFYESYIIPFIVMLISSIFYAIQSQYGSIFQAIGKTWMCLVLNIIWAIFFIVSFIIFSADGVLGYSLAYFISYLIYSIISYICFRGIILNKNKKCIIKRSEITVMKE